MVKMLNNYMVLTKPRILLLVLVTTTIGYYLGAGGGFRSLSQLGILLFGVGFTCAGSSALNQYLEREFDSKMLRTRGRPIPAGLILPNFALGFGVVLVLIGVFVLYVKINILTSFLSLLTTFLYVLVYTPMKRVSWLNTTVGAIPGAMPILGGWSAVDGSLSFDAGVLFLIQFIWQHPHFYAIAWMFKEDYRRGGFKMLPILDQDPNQIFRQIYIYALLLLPVSIIPSLTGLAGVLYFMGSIFLGLFLFNSCLKFIRSKSNVDAKKLLKATVIYLPLLLVLIIFDSFV